MIDLARLRRFRRSAARLARTRYPAFLFGGSGPPGEIPVFTYHEVDAPTLIGDLDFLARNGYRTLGLDEFHDRAASTSGVRDRCVLLTFDDARRNFWDVGWPVLRGRGARAALFVPSYWIGGSAGGPPGAVPPGFMTWEQLRDCERSDLVDVESHAHRHALVSISPRLAGFASPEALARHDLFDWPMRRERGQDVCGRPDLGTPIYESAPLLSAPTRLVEPASAAEACRGLVEAGGGAAFFARRSALAELRAAHGAALERPEWLSSGELRREVEAELTLAVESFRRELGRAPRYFAYPWMLGSQGSLSLLMELGYRAAFGVALDFRRTYSGRAPLAVYGRYKSDWLRFLPGRGRRRLMEVVPRKVASFLRSQHLAH